MKIEFLSGAVQDIRDGFAFYEGQDKGLGYYYVDSIFSDIESLQLYAGIHALHRDYYRMLAKRFPFAIYYRLKDEITRVHAILDCRRNPAWIQERLT